MKSGINKREAFAASVLDLIVRGGIQAVSIRTVAADSGWSVGALQKTFSNKEALLRAAVNLVISRAEARMNALPFSGDAVDYLVRMVEETLPLDQQRREEAIAWNAFAAEAIHTPWIAEILIGQDKLVSEQLVEALRSFGTAQPEAAAAGIIAISDGFALRLLYDPTQAAEFCTALRPIINHLLTI
ncbi:transcriptional regulator [Arthrobacter sp. MYb224]|uniref:TetR/AcrR family transcriptional regulator n=1 Tax=Micrococcaceae TaxID=1268 RepID=UPI000CFC1E60|nr:MULTISPECIES: TetR family transcriptional regulator C-terminal domain-containing protein [unclassified Arthrobacter]PQZ98266.1 transcriptional regulator [Arthrobacter sp. MYb224]PQZ98510.1 transcriptional regulator [Arthrobacter sp. MYb229]